MRALVALAVAVLLGLLWLGFGGRPGTPEQLVGVHSPTFQSAPGSEPVAVSLEHLRSDLLSTTGQTFLRRMVPDQAGVLWLALALTLVVAFDFTRLRNTHNLELALLLAPAVLFFDVLRFLDVLQRPSYRLLMDAVFGLVFTVTIVLIVRALWRAVTPSRWPWQPNLHLRALATLTAVLLTCNMMMALARPPDDAGWFVNLGAQRLRERGKLPYGDPLLTGTPGAAYGPLLYAVHVPFQLAIAPKPLNEHSTARPPLTSESPYYLPPALATKLCTIFFQLVAVVSLFVGATRLSGRRDVGWAMTALYCGSPYILGVGGDEYFIGGMTFVSHIAPAAITLGAFAALPSPAWAGVLLACGAGTGFYPLFMVPPWLAHWWSNRQRMLRFLAGFAIAASLVAGGTWIASRPAEGYTRLGTIMRDTLGHHTDPRGYGSSPFGFWGQRGGIRAWLITPLAGESGLTSPAYLVFMGLVALTAGITRRGSERALALATAAIAAASSLLKIHPTGTYVAWSYGFLLLGLLAADARDGATEADTLLPTSHVPEVHRPPGPTRTNQH